MSGVRLTGSVLFLGAEAEGELGFTLSSNRLWMLPDRSGELAIDSEFLYDFLRDHIVSAAGGTYILTVPENVFFLTYTLWGSGGGAGSGRRGAASTIRSGGGGGGAGAICKGTIPLAAFGVVAGDQLEIRIGTGGSGGPAVATDSANGVAGNAGNPSWIKIGTSGTYLAYALGGQPGAGGSTAAAAGGSSPAVTSIATATGGASVLTGTSTAGSGSADGGGGGGGGGGLTAANVLIVPGNGGVGMRSMDPTKTWSASPPGLGNLPGNGGPGGAAIAGQQNGANGGINAGGGGGSGMLNGTPSGSGGNGGGGLGYLLFS